MDDLISRSALLDICEQQGHVDVDDLVMEPCETNEKYATIMAFNKLRLKVGFTRLCELLQAEVEGRCVVLPCKPSDVTVYQLRSKKHAKGVGISLAMLAVHLCGERAAMRYTIRDLMIAWIAA